ncbi:DNA mismatch repair pms1 [Hyphodiscus hymeniophilus]|uniref:DNA mismatch repair pms1 n=1 Tax=Hyphodiscus hymeniophilus TaxID=353542 RepID=A0A9P6VMA0_9HELO|nr:DNA mismatch repair pms1 [Hyphodiscus hymeniophilus]
MPIAPLPKATVQLLGSSQVLTTPASLVKELIDNALDARATSIDIVVSRNTLDKLEVRDNGHGISSADFDFLGKRGHTSKLRTFEELKFVGSISLGFRGEALASAVQLGNVSVTTKTEGESVATCLVLKAPGVVDTKSRTSHPVGTTVTVQKFLEKIPVRKKNFQKEAPKTLAKINQLLKSYALARPSTRFSLKVTGVSKTSFSFAPRPQGEIKEAISLVIGRDAVMECVEKFLPSTEGGITAASHEDNCSGFDENSHVNSGPFVLEAFLPKLNADPFKIGHGQYLSIDSRPVSHEKGTMKKIVTTFKRYMRGALVDSPEKVKNPFIRLNIKCPVASYDANIEPAKDEVLFGNESVVLELAEKLFKEVYGEPEAFPMVSSSSKSIANEVDNFNLLLARDSERAQDLLGKVSDHPASTSAGIPSLEEFASLHQKSPGSIPPPKPSFPINQDTVTPGKSPATETSNISDEQFSSSWRNWGINMSVDFAEDDNDSRPDGSRLRREQAPDCEVPGHLLNPWTISKINAPTSRDSDTYGHRPPFNTMSSDILSSPIPQSKPTMDSSRSASPARRPRQTLQNNDVWDLQPSFPRRYSASSIRPQPEKEQIIVDENLPTLPRRRHDFVSARNLFDNGLLSPPRTAPKEHSRSRGLKRPFVSSPVTVENRVTKPDRLVQTTLFGNNPRARRQSDGDQVMLLDESQEELAWAMDFEQRKEDATRRRRKEIRDVETRAALSSPSIATRSSPYKNRYNAAIATLEAAQPPIHSVDRTVQSGAPFKTTLPDGDPLAYLMRRQKSLGAKKNAEGRPMMMRTKSTRLPLERIPPDAHVHNLIYHASIDMGKLQTAMEVLADESLYRHLAGEGVGLSIKEVERPSLERKLRKVVDTWIKSDGEQKYEVEYSLGSLLNLSH